MILMKGERLVKDWLPLILWGAFIFYLSSIPNLRTTANPYWDEIIRSSLHGVFYFVFCLLWLRALKANYPGKRHLLSLIFVFLYSLTDEIHQLFVPSRSFQLKDLAVDNLGSLLAVFFSQFLAKSPGGIRNLAERLDLV